MIDFKKLVDARVHFGHKTDRWSPLMEPYIWGIKNKVHLIDVSKTAFQMDRAAKFLESVAAENKQILWVGTKRPAQEIIHSVATSLDMPYINHRWVGGTLTNWPQVKRSVTKMLHFEDVLEKSDKFPHYTKKELNEMRKNLERLQAIVSGIRNLKSPVGALVVVDVNKERTAVKEASKMGIPVIGLVDTNSDPSLVDYVIPANDDSPRSIKVILDYLQEGVKRGKEAAKVKKESEKEEVKTPSETKKLEEDEKRAAPSKKVKKVAKPKEEQEIKKEKATTPQETKKD